MTQTENFRQEELTNFGNYAGNFSALLSRIFCIDSGTRRTI